VAVADILEFPAYS